MCDRHINLHNSRKFTLLHFNQDDKFWSEKLINELFVLQEIIDFNLAEAI